eukprot:4775336-Pyramimonas_sp.AAC.1
MAAVLETFYAQHHTPPGLVANQSQPSPMESAMSAMAAPSGALAPASCVTLVRFSTQCGHRLPQMKTPPGLFVQLWFRRRCIQLPWASPANCEWRGHLDVVVQMHRDAVAESSNLQLGARTAIPNRRIQRNTRVQPFEIARGVSDNCLRFPGGSERYVRTPSWRFELLRVCCQWWQAVCRVRPAGNQSLHRMPPRVLLVSVT